MAEGAETYDVVGAIMDFENGEQSARETVELFSHLVKTGTISGLQGAYHRTAAEMVEMGWLTPDGTVTEFAESVLELFE